MIRYYIAMVERLEKANLGGTLMLVCMIRQHIATVANLTQYVEQVRVGLSYRDFLDSKMT
jgi:hypothetical protein